MGVKSFLRSALKASMSAFDPEKITIGDREIDAIMPETESATPLGVGAKVAERTLVVQFSSEDYPGPIKSGQKVTARGEKWQVSGEDGAIMRGQVATRLRLVEPTRRREF